MNEDIEEILQENQEDIEENQVQIEENQDNVSNIENELENSSSYTESSSNELESSSSDTQEVLSQVIVVDGQPVNYYEEVYRELKVNNFLLQLILVVITVLYLCNKIYSSIRSMLTVKF